MINDNHKDTVLKKDFITVRPEKPTADFNATLIKGIAPFTVQFNDMSSNEPISWIWEFVGAEAVMSTKKNPIIKYNTSGTFRVSLITANASGSDQIIKDGFIIVQKATSIEDASSINNLKIFPNPSDGIINVEYTNESSKNIKIFVSDISGKTIDNEILSIIQGEFVKKIDLHEFPPGIYNMQIIDNLQITLKKIILY